MADPTLVIRILTDAGGAVADLDAAASRFDRFSGRMASLAGPAAAVTAGLAVMGNAAVDAASDAQQAMGAVESVFGTAADQVKTWAAESATAVGLAESEYASLAATMGAQLQNLGLSQADAADGTNELITLAADLAATFGGTTADAVQALSAALRGEADPAERYGLALNQTQINAYLAAQGLDHLTGAEREAAEAQAIMALAAEQAGGAVGQFARETDTAAGAQQIANAQYENAKATLGAALLPVVTAVTQAFAGMAQWVQQNSTVVLVLAGVIGGLAVGILAINAALAAYRAIQTVATAATWLFNAAWLASPITWIVVGILAIVAGIVLLWQKCEGFRNAVIAVWNAVRTAAEVAWKAIQAAVGAVVNWVRSAIANVGAFISRVWSNIRSAAAAVWNAIQAVIRGVIAGITAYINAYKAVVTGVWNAIRAVATTVWNAIRAVVQGVINTIRGIITGLGNAFRTVFNAIRNVATAALNAILAPVRALQNAFNAVIGAIRSVIDWISKIKMPEINLPFGLGASSSSASLYAPAAGVGPLPLVAGAPLAPAAAGRAPTGPTIININGVLTGTDAARTVRRVLRTDERRRSGVVIGSRTP